MAKRVRRGTIWSNLRWIHPTRTGYGTGRQALKEKLRYFTYRDDRNVKAPTGGRWWVDQGLGSTPREILAQCEALTSDDRLAWTVLISPNPRLMALMAEETDRRQCLTDLTEQVMADWFEARGYVDPAYSYVMHDRATTDEGLQQLHTHVILPGTVETAAGRERFDHRPTELRQFNELVEDLFELQLERQVGVRWREEWAAIQREEALKKQWQTWEVLPPNVGELAEQLHQHGLTSDQLPAHITSVEGFQQWWATRQTTDDLDVWLGREVG